MIIYKKFRFLLILEIWHEEYNLSNINHLKKMGIDLIYFKESTNNPLNENYFLNAVIDTKCGYEDIEVNFTAKFRNEVRRGIKENIDIEVSKYPIKDKDFMSDYIDFSRRRELELINIKKLTLYEENYCLVGFTAVDTSSHIRSHLYFESDKEIHLLASFERKGSVNYSKNYLGWANRLLHSEAIKYAAERKIKYNLGGIGNGIILDNKKQNIINFKNEMNPKHEKYYNYVLPLTLKGYMYIVIYKFIRKIYV